MRVTTARFVKCALNPSQYPADRRPEVAFLGRSNVGKSTFLNALLGKRGLAKTSGTPGKTQTINFFEVNGKFYFVDLPGYGYAKVPKALKTEWNRVMVDYFRNRELLRLAVALLDARHAPTEQDVQMLKILEDAQVPTLLVATKSDKLKRSELKASLERIRETLDLNKEALLIPASGVTGEGLREVWRVIGDRV